MAYRLRKETPQLRIKIEEPNGQANNLTRDVWEDTGDTTGLTTQQLPGVDRAGSAITVLYAGPKSTRYGK